MHFTALLFDLDGTLLDTLQDLAESMNAVLARHGYPEHPTDAYRYFVGDGVAQLVVRALPEAARRDPVISDCVREMRDEYAQRWDTQTCLYAGIAALLDHLETMGIVKTILSNKPDDFTHRIVAKYLGDWSFTEVHGARESVPRKPDPTAAIAIAHRLSIPAERFLYVGDTNTDMETARSAGMHAVGALWGFRTERELRDSGAQTLVSKPEDVLSLLRRCQ